VELYPTAPRALPVLITASDFTDPEGNLIGLAGVT
jgi:hypothetical protein